MEKAIVRIRQAAAVIGIAILATAFIAVATAAQGSLARDAQPERRHADCVVGEVVATDDSGRPVMWRDSCE